MVNQQFVDSDHAQIYSNYRPDIPSEIAEKSIAFLKEKFNGVLDTAVDVGCGSGQSSVILAPFFQHVHGLDASESQIHEAAKNRKISNVHYSVQEAETLPFESGSVQLVTAGASLHWFDLDVFFKEVRRLLRPGAAFVAYTYHSLRPVTDCPLRREEVELLYEQIYEDIYPYWPREVYSSLEKYKNVIFPFEEVLRTSNIRQVFQGKFSDLIGFIESLSAFQIMKKKDCLKAQDFIHQFRKRLRELLMTSDKTEGNTMTLYRDFYVVMCRKEAEC